MTMRGFLSKPTPLWFSLVRLAGVLGVLYFLGTDPLWRPVAEEAKETLTAVKRKVDETRAQVPAADGADKQSTTTTAEKDISNANDKRARN